MKWNTDLYDDSQQFVSEYGKDLISFIPNKNGQKILDLGCGTGDLTNQINESFKCDIIGIDYSPEMIQKARLKYPKLHFSICDACTMPFADEFDVIFSNAVFHWIPNQDELHRSIYNALKYAGIMICEFGGYKNIEKISNAFGRVIKQYGDNYDSPFYFPKVEEHTKVLEKSGLKIEKIYEYDRPTILPNGELGLRQWISQFFSSHLNKYDVTVQEEILIAVENDLQVDMFKDNNWIADYRRIRVIAYKPII